MQNKLQKMLGNSNIYCDSNLLYINRSIFTYHHGYALSPIKKHCLCTKDTQEAIFFISSHTFLDPSPASCTTPHAWLIVESKHLFSSCSIGVVEWPFSVFSLSLPVEYQFGMISFPTAKAGVSTLMK